MSDQKKKITIMVIEPRPSSALGSAIDPYPLMETLILNHHKHLTDAKIALAWRLGWKEDKDGLVKLGQAKKASELDKELHDHDFVILLNKEAWEIMGQEKREAVLDHELSHCQACYDEFGEQQEDEGGRLQWRVRKHDIEEFTAVVERHGCYKHEIEQFVKRALEAQREPLFAGVGERGGE